MFVLNDDVIETTIDSVTAFIIATVAKETGKSLCEVAELFYASKVYTLLSNKETGYYWDSIPEMIDLFVKEL